MLENVIVLTIAFTAAMLLASVIGTIAIVAIINSPKAMQWLFKYYVKQIEKACDNLDKVEFKID